MDSAVETKDELVEVKQELEGKSVIQLKSVLGIEQTKKNNKSRIKKKKTKKIRCTKCKKYKTFDTKKQLDEHVLKDHTRTRDAIICEFCCAVLKSDNYYKRHLATRHRQREYTCDHCAKVFSAKEYLINHIERHKQTTQLQCAICLTNYLTIQTYRRHLKSHLEKFQCQECGCIFNQIHLLDNHIASKHSDALPSLQCEFCTRMFPSTIARNNHHYLAHRNRKSPDFKCLECNITFEMKEELRIHSFIHFSGEIRTCPECAQIFKSNRLLQIHMMKHQEKQFMCDVCGDFFTFKSGLSKHKRWNRCKGPNNSKKSVELRKKDMSFENEVEIATLQLMATKKRKTIEKAFQDVMADFREEAKSESESDHEQFDLFSNAIDVCGKNEKEEQPVIKIAYQEAAKEKQISESKKRKHRGRQHLTYICDYCNESIKFKHKMIKHLKEHVLHKRHKCRHCNEAFKSRRLILQHSLSVHGFKPKTLNETYKCNELECGAVFDVKSAFQVHQRKHKDERNYSCFVCNLAFKSNSNLRRHYLVHEPERIWTCEICTKSFKTKASCKSHMESVHAEVSVYVSCPLCSSIVKEKNLRVHMKNMHANEGLKPFYCTECDNYFRTKSSWKRHRESFHEPVNRGVSYECPSCPGLVFNRHRDLKQHSFIHFNGKIHGCSTCHKLFKSRRLVLIHQAMHNPVQYPCPDCNVIFQTPGGRRKHFNKNHKSLLEPKHENEHEQTFVEKTAKSIFK